MVVGTAMHAYLHIYIYIYICIIYIYIYVCVLIYIQLICCLTHYPVRVTPSADSPWPWNMPFFGLPLRMLLFRYWTTRCIQFQWLKYSQVVVILPRRDAEGDKWWFLQANFSHFENLSYLPPPRMKHFGIHWAMFRTLVETEPLLLEVRKEDERHRVRSSKCCLRRQTGSGALLHPWTLRNKGSDVEGCWRSSG